MKTKISIITLVLAISLILEACAPSTSPLIDAYNNKDLFYGLQDVIRDYCGDNCIVVHNEGDSERVLFLNNPIEVSDGVTTVEVELKELPDFPFREQPQCGDRKVINYRDPIYSWWLDTDESNDLSWEYNEELDYRSVGDPLVYACVTIKSAP